MCWPPLCKWGTEKGFPTVVHKWGCGNESSGQYPFLGLEAKYKLPVDIFGYETRVWLGPMPQQLQWDISTAQALHFGRLCMYADSKVLPGSHTESGIISCLNLVFLFLMASILNHSFEAFHTDYLRSKGLSKCLDKLAALINTKGWEFPEWICNEEKANRWWLWESDKYVEREASFSGTHHQKGVNCWISKMYLMWRNCLFTYL